MKKGDLVADRYELEELAGTGGMSNVYRAYDTLLERRVALKVLHEKYSNDQEYVERFRREAQAIARLSHPNIVTVINRGEWEQHQYIVFEFVAGETLKQLVERAGPLPVREALVLLREVAGGLAFAHEHGVVHRDVKPHNVIIDAEGTPKLTDFGLARSLDRADGLTTTGTLLGTSDYLAPEQAAGQPVSAQSDQYSLGVLLYELLTGDVPYPAESLVAAAMRHLNEPVPSAREARPEVPAEVDELVRRAMQKRPEERFASTAAFVTALEACLARYDEDTLSDARPAGGATRISSPRAPVRERPQPSDPPKRRQPRRRRTGLVVRLVALLVLVVAVTVGAYIVLHDGGSVLPGRDSGGPSGSGGERVRLTAVADYDPGGDENEHPETVPAATDGDASSYWTTETYSSFDKAGVGIVVRAARPVEGGTLVVRSDEPGFTAKIKGSSRKGGGFVTISAPKTVGARTSFELDTKSESYRFLLVWITSLDGVAHVNEVTLR